MAFPGFYLSVISLEEVWPTSRSPIPPTTATRVSIRARSFPYEKLHAACRIELATQLPGSVREILQLAVLDQPLDAIHQC